MRLTLQTDYALRALIYTAARPGVWVSSLRLAAVYDVSSHHMSKVAKDLVVRGYLRARRGQSGGFQLARDPAAIRLGELVRELEPTMALLDCFEPEPGGCLLSPECSLRHALMDAQQAFLDHLNQQTLADLMGSSGSLAALFQLREKRLASTESSPDRSSC